jgi:acyl carrier protein
MAYGEQALSGYFGGTSAREWSPTERTLVEIWTEVLDVAPSELSLTSDFTHFGGDSIAVKRMMLRVRDRLGVSASLGIFYEARTLEAFARRLDLLGRSELDREKAQGVQWEEGSV